MKAVWFNSVGTVFDVIDDKDGVSVVAKLPHVWNVLMPGDSIRLVEDEDDSYTLGRTYDKMRTA